DNLWLWSGKRTRVPRRSAKAVRPRLRDRACATLQDSTDVTGREIGEHELGNVRQLRGNDVAAAKPEATKDLGESAHTAVQFGVRERRTGSKQCSVLRPLTLVTFDPISQRLIVPPRFWRGRRSVASMAHAGAAVLVSTTSPWRTNTRSRQAAIGS